MRTSSMESGANALSGFPDLPLGIFTEKSSLVDVVMLGRDDRVRWRLTEGSEGMCW